MRLERVRKFGHVPALLGVAQYMWVSEYEVYGHSICPFRDGCSNYLGIALM